MTRPASSDDFFKIPGYQVLPEEGTTSAKRVIADFCQGTQPLSSLPEPSAHADPIRARQEVISHLQIALDTPPTAENKAKRGVVLQKLDSLGAFAKTHPMLTTNFFVAMLMAVDALYLTMQTVLGQSTTSIFKAHPSLGAGVTFMQIDYSAYMINLCRLAAENIASLKSARAVAETEAHCETLLRALTPLLYGDNPREEVLRILHEPAHGAKLFAS